ncbi:regulator of microtubule dynamics protein 1-like [Sitophilus oryzae]|uniref:Regulator of microtubule dynamics protein 1 n=1 Tax=Sitophilus oryzae TaxID=7048 RepID=A0A6J2XN57_SITOR|nr:regulator of microtubule dynamics protein 1-like [Sitophilus oryzae]
MPLSTIIRQGYVNSIKFLYKSKLSVRKRSTKHPLITPTKYFILSIGMVEYVWSLMPNNEDKEKIAKYWQNEPLGDVIEKADQMLKEGQYMEVYEMLNRLKYSQDLGVIWRTVKALYNISLNEDLTVDVRKIMLQEAYDILMKSATLGDGKAYYHKWLAVILNAKNGLESLETKVTEYTKIQDHLKIACQTNPKDFTIQYMLGKYHYEMANMTWFQRFLARYLFKEPPKSNFEEAYKHLNKAEELLPRTFLPNVYLLGSVCIELGQYYRAKYYLNMALNLPTHTECDQCCSANAKRILEKLEKYDLGKDLLYENYDNFGFHS